MERIFKNRLGGSGKKMRKPSWIFDSRSIKNSKEVSIAGLKYLLIGEEQIHILGEYYKFFKQILIKLPF